jgi:hypothetical protein
VSKLARLLQNIPANYSRSSFTDILNTLVQQVDSLSEGKRSAYHGAMSAPPTTGAHVRGDWVKNSLPSPSGFFGWICTDSGEPGTWKGFGLIQG